MLKRFALSTFLAALACREPPPPRVVAAAPRPGVFLGVDLAAAAELDARLARLSALAAEFEVALLHEGGARLDRSASRLEPLLDAAAAEVDRALDGVRDPRDRELAAPLVAAARRWPQLLRDVRAELRAGPGKPGPAARALDDNAVEVARRLDAYRRFRANWRIADAREEDPGALAFHAARRDLEAMENRLGELLPGPVGSSPSRLGEASDLRPIVAALGRARDAALRLDAGRRAAAQAWVDAQERSLLALVALATPPPPAAEAARAAVTYQSARAEALAAGAELARLDAVRAATR
jgi:hypothetical protein